MKIAIGLSISLAFLCFGPSFARSQVSTTACSRQFHWTAPTTNTDGTPLKDLTAYEVWRGNSGNNFGALNAYINPAYNAFMDNNVPIPGTYYYAVSAIDSSGVFSALSNIITVSAAECPAAPTNLF